VGAKAASGVAVCALVLVCAPTVGMPVWMLAATGDRAAMLATRVIPILFNSVAAQKRSPFARRSHTPNHFQNGWPAGRGRV
jgi:hypothetical protein